MSPTEELYSIIGNVDIYLVDQILKGRYSKNDVILDAGCGSGRNLKWFVNNGFTIWGVDSNKEVIANLKIDFPNYSERFKVSDLKTLAYDSHYFNHVICNAVLHFAKNKEHFYELFTSLIRVLKPNGTLFIRMASNFGVPPSIKESSSGVYFLPDGTYRFLLTHQLLGNLLNDYNLKLLEPIKTTNVQDMRWMTTLMLKKE